MIVPHPIKVKFQNKVITSNFLSPFTWCTANISPIHQFSANYQPKPQALYDHSLHLIALFMCSTPQALHSPPLHTREFLEFFHPKGTPYDMKFSLKKPEKMREKCDKIMKMVLFS